MMKRGLQEPLGESMPSLGRKYHLLSLTYHIYFSPYYSSSPISVIGTTNHLDIVIRNLEVITDSLCRLFSACPPLPPHIHSLSFSLNLQGCLILSSTCVWTIKSTSRSLRGRGKSSRGSLPLAWPWTSCTSWTKIADPVKAGFLI